MTSYVSQKDVDARQYFSSFQLLDAAFIVENGSRNRDTASPETWLQINTITNKINTARVADHYTLGLYNGERERKKKEEKKETVSTTNKVGWLGYKVHQFHIWKE